MNVFEYWIKGEIDENFLISSFCTVIGVEKDYFQPQTIMYGDDFEPPNVPFYVYDLIYGENETVVICTPPFG